MGIIPLFAEGFTPTEQPSLTSGLVLRPPYEGSRADAGFSGYKTGESSLEKLIELLRSQFPFWKWLSLLVAVF